MNGVADDTVNKFSFSSIFCGWAGTGHFLGPGQALRLKLRECITCIIPNSRQRYGVQCQTPYNLMWDTVCPLPTCALNNKLNYRAFVQRQIHFLAERRPKFTQAI